MTYLIIYSRRSRDKLGVYILVVSVIIRLIEVMVGGCWWSVVHAVVRETIKKASAKVCSFNIYSNNITRGG